MVVLLQEFSAKHKHARLPGHSTSISVISIEKTVIPAGVAGHPLVYSVRCYKPGKDRPFSAVSSDCGCVV